MADEDKVLVECDGCGKQIEVTRVRLDDEVDLLMCDCDKFWGWMEVGGQAWKDYHERGVHPMQDLLDCIKKRLAN